MPHGVLLDALTTQQAALVLHFVALIKGPFIPYLGAGRILFPCDGFLIAYREGGVPFVKFDFRHILGFRLFVSCFLR